MSNSVKYVRLPNEGENNNILPVGILADVDGGSGWSISGLDVKEYPSDDEPEAQKFVRSALAQGRLEESSQGEFDLIQKSNSEMSKLFPKPAQDQPVAPWNEPALIATARKHRRNIVSHRVSGGSEGEIETGDYASMGIDELRSRAENRGLDTDGTKKELRTRLEEADAADAS